MSTEPSVDARRAHLRAQAGDRWPAVERFEDRMATPLTLSALLPIVLALTGQTTWFTDLVSIVTWVVFLVDLVFLSRNVRGYVRTGWGIFDLVVVILTFPWFLIPGLGYTSILMLARLGRLVRLLIASGGARKLFARVGRIGLYAVGVVVVAAWVVLQAEREVNHEFQDYGDALWWAIVTITTVGYGDITPITSDGRVAAAVLMISGLGIVASLAGVLSSFLGDGSAKEAEPAPAAPALGAASVAGPGRPGLSAEDAARLREHAARLEQELGNLQRTLAGEAPGAPRASG